MPAGFLDRLAGQAIMLVQLVVGEVGRERSPPTNGASSHLRYSLHFATGNLFSLLTAQQRYLILVLIEYTLNRNR